MKQIYNVSQYNNHYQHISPTTMSYIKTGNVLLPLIKKALSVSYVALGALVAYVLLASL